MKKLLILLLTLSLVLSLAACGGNPDKADNDDQSTPSGSNGPDDNTNKPDADKPNDSDKSDDTDEPDSADEPDGEPVSVNFAVLTGPTGVGAVKLWESSDAGSTFDKYTVTAVADNSQIQAGLINGDYDIAAVATNVASALYNKTQGQVKVIAINTLGVLYVLENGDTVHSVADLKGKTIYSAGQGANPEYVLTHILTKNGLTVSTSANEVENADVNVIFDDASVIQTKMAAGEIDLAMLPVPAATAVLIQNKDVRSALDMTAEWDALKTGGQLTMGCVAVRAEFAENNPRAVERFLQEYESSINAVKSDPDSAAALCETYGIVPKAAIAKRAIPDCNLTFVAGASEIKSVLEPYYQVLFDANPASIGGAMPDEAFYWQAG